MNIRHILSSFLSIFVFYTFSHIAHAQVWKQKYQIQGEFTQGGIIRGQAATGTHIKLNNTPIIVSPEGRFVLGFGRDAVLTHSLFIVNPDKSEDIITFVLKKREYNIQKIEGISKKIMNPNEKDLVHIRQDSADATQARATRLDDTYFAQSFIWPVTGPISGVYGSQRVYNGVPKRPHYGVDVAVPTGTVIVAPTDGLITLAKPDMFYSGGTIILDHGHGLSSSFLHLSKLLVRSGQKVKQGEPIGEVGATGRVTGPHLDWRMNWLDERVDPVLIVEPMLKK